MPGKLKMWVVQYWKWILIAIVALIILLWINSKIGMAGKLWEMVKGDIVHEQETINQDLAAEVQRLSDEKETLAKQIETVKAAKLKIEKEKTRLEADKIILQKKLEAVSVPSSAGGIVDEFHRLGLSSARRNMR